MFTRSFKILYKVRSKMKNFSVHSAVSNDSVSLIKSIPQIVKLINALYEKDLIFMNNFVELVLGEHDFVTLDDFISYPYKPIRNYFCREINNQGEVVLNNMATIDTSAKISPPCTYWSRSPHWPIYNYSWRDHCFRQLQTGKCGS